MSIKPKNNNKLIAIAKELAQKMFVKQPQKKINH